MSEILHNLGINLKVLAVQVVAFLILFWVLSKFLFGKIGGFLKKRQDEIQGSFKEIEQSKSDVERLMQEYKKKLIDIEKEAHEKMQEAVREGVKIKSELIEQTHQQLARDREKALAQIALEKEKLVIELRQKVAELAVAAAEKVINEKIDGPLQYRLVERYIENLEKMKT